jgi:hypothetical protein
MKNTTLYILLLALLSLGFTACEIEALDDDDSGYYYVDYYNLNYHAPAIFTGTINGQQVVLCDSSTNYQNYDPNWAQTEEYSGYYANTGTWNWHAYTSFCRNGNNTSSLAIKTGVVSYPFYSFGGSNYITPTKFFGYFKIGLNDFYYANEAFTTSDGTNLDQYMMYIRYKDENNVIWTSYDGPQTGSNFQITDTIRYKDYDIMSSELKLKFKASFNCKLYNSSGQSITLENGRFMGEFWDDHP